MNTGFVARPDVSGAVAIIRAPKAKPIKAKQVSARAVETEQDSPEEAAPESAAADPTEIIVTGTKRARGESVQEAAVTISAFGSEQLEESKIRDLYALGNLVPNVEIGRAPSRERVCTYV